MLDRRAFVAALPLLLAFRGAPAPDLLARAIERAGGREALRRARALRWTGTATIFAAGKMIGIGVDTMVEPFRRARSTSWLLEQGPASRRSMVLEPADAWLERRGVRLPMPERMRTHEQQQFAIYGLMRLTDLQAPSVAVRAAGNTLRVRHPAAPETLLRFDEQATLIGAENQVRSAEDGSTILQHFHFGDHRRVSGILWPHLIRIDQNGRPYFELRIASFSAG
ncbi:hypothetical protein [Sphingomonas sp.]|jgi:hypothetical protein|uniref:hypothetical protein n=1 Tax=Sphingomonas sp. TaxID=28214 RepID=UPI002DE2B8FD|nr:hypothetical protein [Sphingomonas sp.]